MAMLTEPRCQWYKGLSGTRALSWLYSVHRDPTSSDPVTTYTNVSVETWLFMFHTLLSISCWYKLIGSPCIFISWINAYKSHWNASFGKILDALKIYLIYIYKIYICVFVDDTYHFWPEKSNNDANISKHRFSKCSLPNRTILQKAVISPL